MQICSTLSRHTGQRFSKATMEQGSNCVSNATIQGKKSSRANLDLLRPQTGYDERATRPALLRNPPLLMGVIEDDFDLDGHMKVVSPMTTIKVGQHDLAPFEQSTEKTSAQNQFQTVHFRNQMVKGRSVTAFRQRPTSN